MNIEKTQFLVDATGRLATFRRKREHILFEGDKPLRVITWDDWTHMKKTWPDHVERDNITVQTGWVLKRI